MIHQMLTGVILGWPTTSDFDDFLILFRTFATFCYKHVLQ